MNLPRVKKLFFHTIIIPNSYICCYHGLTCKVKTNYFTLPSWYILLILVIYSNSVQYTPKTTSVQVTMTSMLSNQSSGQFSGLVDQKQHGLLITFSSLVFQDTTLSPVFPFALVAPVLSTFLVLPLLPRALNFGIASDLVLDSFLHSLHSLPR